MKPSTILLRLFFFQVIFSITFSNQCFSQDDWLRGWREATISIGILDSVILKDQKSLKPIIGLNSDTLYQHFFNAKGTAVIFSPPDTSNKIPFLVTAKHVFYYPKEKWDPAAIQLRFTWFADKSVTEYLGIRLLLKDSRGNRLWIPHPDPNVDLAMIPLVISQEAAGRPTVNPVTLNDFATPTDVFEGASILLFGYPGSVGPYYWTKPVIRHGVIAYVNPYKFGKVPILVDAMVFPGNSGGPVFTVPSGMAKDGSFAVTGRSVFLGIVSLGFREIFEVEKFTVPLFVEKGDTTTHYVSFNYMGLAAIEPAERVKELLNLIPRK